MQSICLSNVVASDAIKIKQLMYKHSSIDAGPTWSMIYILVSICLSNVVAIFRLAKNYKVILTTYEEQKAETLQEYLAAFIKLMFLIID